MRERKTKPVPSAPPPTTKRRLILIAMTPDESYRRIVMEGIAEFGEQGVDWEFFVHRPGLSTDSLAMFRFDGVIAEPGIWPSLKLDPAIPAVTVTGDPVTGGPPAVIADNEAVGRLGAAHLADAGLKQLAYCHIPRMRYSEARWQGFSQVATRRHVPCTRFEFSEAELHYGEPDAALSAWLTALPKPVGIMAANDPRAEQIMHACHAAGVRIPEDVALLGVNNDFPTCRLTLPPLSSVDQGIRKMGYRAASLLHELMDGKPAALSGVVVIPPDRVVTRRSTDLLAVANPDVATGLAFIRDNAEQGIKVRDVLQRVAVSRRTLENGFKSAIGRTIQGEITRVRLDRAKHLLTHTDISMPEIADACGIPYASQLSYLFKRECGMPPMEYRRIHRVPPRRRRF